MKLNLQTDTFQFGIKLTDWRLTRKGVLSTLRFVFERIFHVFSIPIKKFVSSLHFQNKDTGKQRKIQLSMLPVLFVPNTILTRSNGCHAWTWFPLDLWHMAWWSRSERLSHLQCAEFYCIFFVIITISQSKLAGGHWISEATVKPARKQVYVRFAVPRFRLGGDEANLN